ncbi:hypothetical protein MRX96_029304 [Rhipicephalus microplus]
MQLPTPGRGGAAVSVMAANPRSEAGWLVGSTEYAAEFVRPTFESSAPGLAVNPVQGQHLPNDRVALNNRCAQPSVPCTPALNTLLDTSSKEPTGFSRVLLTLVSRDHSTLALRRRGCGARRSWGAR